MRRITQVSTEFSIGEGASETEKETMETLAVQSHGYTKEDAGLAGFPDDVAVGIRDTEIGPEHFIRIETWADF